jgi:hypothetical protein
VLLASAVLAACHSATPPPSPYAVREVAELARWQVFAGDTAIGYVLQLEIRDPKGPLPYYRIEDLQGRWLGHATANGRFSRRVPFQEREEDLGVWPMARGVAKLFDASAPVDLRPVAIEADARRPR